MNWNQSPVQVKTIYSDTALPQSLLLSRHAIAEALWAPANHTASFSRCLRPETVWLLRSHANNALTTMSRARLHS